MINPQGKIEPIPMGKWVSMASRGEIESGGAGNIRSLLQKGYKLATNEVIQANKLKGTGFDYIYKDNPLNTTIKSAISNISKSIKQTSFGGGSQAMAEDLTDPTRHIDEYEKGGRYGGTIKRKKRKVTSKYSKGGGVRTAKYKV